MQPANFDYHQANSVDEAESLFKANADASFLAGGKRQSLPPLKHAVGSASGEGNNPELIALRLP